MASCESTAERYPTAFCSPPFYTWMCSRNSLLSWSLNVQPTHTLVAMITLSGWNWHLCHQPSHLLILRSDMCVYSYMKIFRSMKPKCATYPPISCQGNTEWVELTSEHITQSSHLLILRSHMLITTWKSTDSCWEAVIIQGLRRMRPVLAVVVVLLLGLHAALNSDVTELGKGGK